MTATALHFDGAHAAADNTFTFAIAKSALTEALSRIVPLAQSGKLPIAQTVLLESFGDALQLTTTNFDQWATTRIPGVVSSALGSAALPAKRLLEIVSALPSGQTITVAVKSRRAKITAGKSKFELVGMPADEWPTIETFDASTSLAVEAGRLHAAIDRTASHLGETSDSTSRPFLNGVCLDAGPNGVVAVGSNGQTWAIIQITSDAVLAPFNVIVPREALPQMKRLLASVPSGESVTLSTGEGKCRITASRSSLLTRLLSATYPLNFMQQLDRKPVKLYVTVNRADLLAATDRVRLVLPPNQPKYVELSFTESAIEFQADGDDLGTGQDEVEAHREVVEAGAVRRLALDASLLAVCLKSLTTERVRISVTGDASPMILRGDVAESVDCAVLALMRQRYQSAAAAIGEGDDDV